MKRVFTLVSPHLVESVGLWLIIAGLIGEASLVFSWISSTYEKPLTFCFTLMIAVGVWLESKAAAEIGSEKDAAVAEANATAAKANERAAQLEKEAAELQLKLHPLTTYRSLDQEQTFELIASLARYPTLRVGVVPGWTTKEVTDFSRTLANLINFALMTGGAPPKYEGNLTPVILQSADGWLGQVADGVTVVCAPNEALDHEFASELERLLNAAGITARTKIEPHKPGHVGVFVGAVPSASINPSTRG